MGRCVSCVRRRFAVGVLCHPIFVRSSDSYRRHKQLMASPQTVNIYGPFENGFTNTVAGMSCLAATPSARIDSRFNPQRDADCSIRNLRLGA